MSFFYFGGWSALCRPANYGCRTLVVFNGTGFDFSGCDRREDQTRCSGYASSPACVEYCPVEDCIFWVYDEDNPREHVGR